MNTVDFTSSTIDAPGSWGTISTYPIGINDAGQVAGWWEDSSRRQSHGFIAVPPYSSTNWTSVDYASGGSTAFEGMNGQGRVSGTYTDSSGSDHGFVYSAIDGWTKIDACKGKQGTVVTGINNNGLVVGYCPSSSGYSPFLYDVAHGVSIPISVPTSPYCVLGGQPWGINDSNVVVGFVQNCEGNDLTDGFYSTPNP